MKKIKVMNILLIFMMLQNSLSAWLPKQQVKRSKKSKSSKKGEIFSKKSLTGEPVKGAQATLTTGKVSQQKQAAPMHNIQSQNTQTRINLVKKVIKDPAAKTEAFVTESGTTFITRNAQGKVVHSIQQFKNGRSVETIISQATGKKEFITYDSGGKRVHKVNREGLILTSDGKPTGHTLSRETIAAVGNNPQQKAVAAPVNVSSQPGMSVNVSQGQQGGAPIVIPQVQATSAPVSFWKSPREYVLQRGKEMLMKPKSKKGKESSGVPVKNKQKKSLKEKFQEAKFQVGSGVDMIGNIQWSKGAGSAVRTMSGLAREGSFALNAVKKQFNKRLGTKFKVSESRNTAMTRLAIQRVGSKISKHQETIVQDKQTIDASQKKLKTEKDPFLREHLEKTISHKTEQVRLRKSEIVALQGQRTTLMGTKFNVEGYKHAPAVVV